MQTLSGQQQHDILASLFPAEDNHSSDTYHSSRRNHAGGRNPSPASSSSSSVLHDTQGGPPLIDSSSTIRRNSAANHGSSSNNNMFSSSSPIQPQSPNTQLTMQLLGSLMQMQGLDSNFPVSTPLLNSGFGSGSGGASTSNMGGYGTSSFANSLNMGNMTGNNTGSSNHSPNPSFGSPGPSGHSTSTTALLEQQIKLQQLQQLQQLQNQIFQQQIALISSQTPAIIPTQQPDDFHQPQQQNSHPTSPSFTGLPTPGPSNELRPQQPQLDFDRFSQLPSSMASSHGHHGLQFSHHSDDFLHRGTNSAPEHIAFHVTPDPTSSPHFTGGSRPDHDLDISPLTSPWLGAYAGNVPHSNDADKSHEPSLRHSEQRQSQASNKRGPPMNGEDASFSRKKHSSGISSVVDAAGGNSARRPYHKGSKSTNSTPLLRGSRSRSKSGAGNAYATTPFTPGTHHIDTSAAYPTPGGSVMDSSHSLPSIPGDTPSPVDLSMPPPPLPLHDPPETNNNADDGGQAVKVSGTQLTPLTPGVVMKLGPFSTNSSGANTPLPTPSVRNIKAKSKPKGESNAKASKDASPSGQSGSGLKHILPAGAPTNQPAGPPAVEGPAKKVSHKDAEQKRRDSQKTAYDDLRRLLPPITFEDDDDPMSGVVSKKKDEVIPVRGPLPPGALPPRGPPKAGGEGPNKGVSKLQVLICGNQYIRTLKGRLERRDGEIAKLRREVGRLRRKTEVLEVRWERVQLSGGLDMEGGGMDMDLHEEEEEEEEDIDLERDLDAIESMGVHIGLVGDYDEEGED